MKILQTLQQYVLQSADLREPMNYFFDLMDADAFSGIKSHRPIKLINQYPELMAVTNIMQEAANERLGKSLKQITPLFHEIPEYYFFHGAFMSPGLVIPLVVIYFSNIKTGIFACADKQTDIMRFSLMKQSDMKASH